MVPSRRSGLRRGPDRRAAVPAPRPVRTVTIDLGAPVPDVELHGADRLHVTALLGGRPLGIADLHAPLDPFPAALLAAELRARFGWARTHATLVGHRDVRPDPAARPSAVVAVCTRDRPADLERCLASLAELQPRLDVLVVDNGSTGPATREVAAAAGARYVHEPLPGLDRARNRAVAEVAEEVVLFTDDDVEVDPAWAGRLLDCFEDPLVMAATGLVLPARLDTAARQRFERYAGFSLRGLRRQVYDGTRTSAMKAGRAGAGASMAFRTGFLRSTAGFPEELDAGMPTGSGGDTYALYRVLRAGFRIVYEPGALVFHHHRDSEDALRTALRGYGTGTYSFFAHAAVADRDPAAVIGAARAAVGYTAKTVARSLLRRPGAPPADLALAEAGGALATLRAYPEARRLVRARGTVLGAAEPLEAPLLGVLAGRLPEPGDGAAEDGAEDGDLPTLSVVIPSRGRRVLLLRLLRALDRCGYPEDRVEVVVVLDGDLDGSAAAVADDEELRRRPRVVVLETPPGRGNGAGVARNRGADVATGDVLLFLDDDVVPAGDGLLLAHGRAQAERPAVVVGPCPPERWSEAHPFARHVRGWWVDHTVRLLREEVLTATDVGTGNVSIPRDRFLEVGGFAPLPRREDWELGHRLLLAGTTVRAAPDAAVWHRADVDLGNALADRRAEGAGDLELALAHPGTGPLLPLGSWPDQQGFWRWASGAALLAPAAVGPAIAVARPLLAAYGALGLVPPWVRLLGRLQYASYWAGVADAAGDERRLAAALRPIGTEPAVLDLGRASSWQPPPAGGATEVVIVDGEQVIGVAPLRWGGHPWDRSRFLSSVADEFTARALQARARRAAGVA